jgi:hypothetical protein
MTDFDFTAKELTLELFVRVDDAMPEIQKHPLAKLHPSEAVTIGLLYALRGSSFRAFYRWLRRELRSLFPHLPERTRLHRVLCACAAWTERFLAQPTFFGVLDSYGIELLHPRRCGRTKNQWARIGKSNGRWIAGAKLGLSINNQGQVVNWEVAPANVSDLEFLPLAHALQEQSILLADRGFLLSRKPKKAYLHKRKGRRRAGNVQVCERGQWPPRRLVETVFALLTQIFALKHLTQRQRPGVVMHVAYAIAAYNICTSWHGAVDLHLAQFAL